MDQDSRRAFAEVAAIQKYNAVTENDALHKITENGLLFLVSGDGAVKRVLAEVATTILPSILRVVHCSVQGNGQKIVKPCKPGHLEAKNGTAGHFLVENL